MRAAPVLLTAALLAGTGCFTTDAAKQHADPRDGIVPPVLGPDQSTAAPASPDLPTPEAAKLAITMAESLEKAGRDGEAAGYYEKARAADPALADRCRRRLAVLYDKLDLPAKSSAEFDALLKDHPDDADLLNDVGYSHYNRGQWADAERYLRRATDVSATHQRAWMNLGLALAQQNRADEAYAAFLRVVTPASAHVNLAFVLATQGKKELARAEYEKALALEPNHENARMALAKLDAAPAPAAK